MSFHPIVRMPEGYEVYDFTQGYDPNRVLATPFGIGRYDERRVNMYNAPLFGGERNVHMGIDLGAPAGTPVHAFEDGEVFLFGDNADEGDYGPTLVTKHRFGDRDLYVLLGHLSRASLQGKRAGETFARGDVLAWVGEKHENGGWNPHVHVQLAWDAPLVADMPGAVSEVDREGARTTHPDPRLILGPLY